MKELMIVDGRVRRVDRVERGALIVYDKEEWRERIRALYNRSFKVMVLLLLLMILGPMLMMVLAIRDLPNGLQNEFAYIMMPSLAIMYLFALLVPILLIKYRLSKDPVGGLYERGFQFPMGAFLPYSEIERVDEPKKMTRWSPMVVPMRPRGRDKMSMLQRAAVPQNWLIRLDLLGPEGAAELARRVEGRVDVQMPPELVIYGPPQKSYARSRTPHQDDFNDDGPYGRV